MTNTALKNRELDTKRAEIRSKETIADKDRRQKNVHHAEDIDFQRRKAKGDWIMSGVGSGLNAFGRIMSKVNDPSWYKNIPELATVTSALPTYWQAGTIMPGNQGQLSTVPYVMAFNYLPSWQGEETLNTDVAIQASSLNLAAARFQAYLREHNSRVAGYEPGDLFQMLLQEIDVFANLEFARKVLGFALFADANIREARYSLILACGFKPQDLIANRANYIAKFNTLVEYANSNLPVPSDLPYLNRQIFLARAFYKDCNIRQGQVYLTRKAFLYQYDEANAALDVNMADNLLDMGTYLALIEDQISRVQYSSALQTMLADIRAGISKFYTCAPITFDYISTPVVVDEVLYQLMNADVMAFATYQADYDNSTDALTASTYVECGNYIFPSTLTHKNFSIVQNSSGLLYSGYGLAASAQIYTPGGTGSPSVNMRACMSYSQYVRGLNFYKDEITSDDVIVSSRLKIPAMEKYVVAGTTNGQIVRRAGDVVIACVSLVYPQRPNLTGVTTIISFGHEIPATYSFENSICLGFTNFDWSPKFMLHEWTLNAATSPEGGTRHILHEWGNFVELPTDVLANLNKMCLQSLLYTPVSTFSKGMRS